MALIKNKTVPDKDWTLVAQGAFDSVEIDTSTHYTTTVHIQAFIDTTDTTAHTGTEFIIMKAATPITDPVMDEDWSEHVRAEDLVGTMNPEPNITVADPAPKGTTTLLVASTTGYVAADVPLPWIAIQDPTLANSELALLTSIVANTSLTILKGTSLAHPKTTTIIGNVACSRRFEIDTLDINRLLVIANNRRDSNGAKIYWKVSTTFTTGI